MAREMESNQSENEGPTIPTARSIPAQKKSHFPLMIHAHYYIPVRQVPPRVSAQLRPTVLASDIFAAVSYVLWGRLAHQLPLSNCHLPTKKCSVNL
jgi:hypothetical protein